MPNQKANSKKGKESNDKPLQPDPETLQTPDPQEEMKGPISSIVQNIKEAASDDITKEEADKIKEKNM